MCFFKRPRKIEHRIETAQHWWRIKRADFISISHFKTDQTKRLIKYLDALACKPSWEKDDHLALYTRILDWEFMHKQIIKKPSKRDLYITELKLRVYKDLESPNGGYLSNCIATQLKNDTSSYIHHVNLKQLSAWWMKESKLSLFKPRSTATKTLDSVIKWYTDFRLNPDLSSADNQKAIRHVLNAILVWKMDRTGKSEREYDVVLLQNLLLRELNTIKDTSNLTLICQTPC